MDLAFLCRWYTLGSKGPQSIEIAGRGPVVRILLPPAVSLQTDGSSPCAGGATPTFLGTARSSCRNFSSTRKDAGGKAGRGDQYCQQRYDHDAAGARPFIGLSRPLSYR
jgi:hypothetical protein